LAQLLEDTRELSLPQVSKEVRLINESLDDLPAFLPCLKELAALPPSVASAWRRFPP